LVRDWRVRRRRSQLDVAHEVGVSPRHLSFVETGRSKASPELLLAIADHLEVPLRERNTLLLAGGYAPRYSQSSLDSDAMARLTRTLERMLSAHDPYPGLVIDRYWNVVIANRAASRMVEGLPSEVVGPPLNVFRVSLHPDGLARQTRNFAAWAAHLLRQLERATVLTGDPVLERLTREVLAYPNVAQLGDWHASSDREPGVADEAEILIPLRLATPAGELSFFTTLTVFGTPQDITLSELAVELFFPADDESERLLRGLPDT
jgi:transcriptional regulator with XRE-family HTH domain